MSHCYFLQINKYGEMFNLEPFCVKSKLAHIKQTETN